MCSSKELVLRFIFFKITILKWYVKCLFCILLYFWKKDVILLFSTLRNSNFISRLGSNISTRNQPNFLCKMGINNTHLLGLLKRLNEMTHAKHWHTEDIIKMLDIITICTLLYHLSPHCLLIRLSPPLNYEHLEWRQETPPSLSYLQGLTHSSRSATINVFMNFTA